MRPIRSASVLIPTWQAMEFLERVLVALARQETSLEWDVHVIDSGSSDGTLECLARFRATFPVPLSVDSIPSAAFDHGDTRNLLAARSRGELLVPLTQDAIPSSPHWLETLARNFDDPTVGAAYCRNVPRADCWPLTRVACQSDPGYSTRRSVVRLPPREVYDRLDPSERRQLYNFNDVASAVRRELWERHPFPRTMMGEDVLMARAVLEAGFAVVYDAEATVDHSHDYEPDKQRWRGDVDARFNAEWLDRLCVAKPADVPVLTERLVASDLAGLAALGHLPEERRALEPRARALRGAFVQGLFEGSQAQRRYPRTRVRATSDVRVVLVVAGDASALLGAGIHHHGAHVCELGLALLRRGHRVTVVALDQRREPVPMGDVATTSAGGLRVQEVRCADEAAGLALLIELLGTEAPDVVHTFDAAAMRLVARAAWARGLPLVVTLHGGFGAPEQADQAAGPDELLDVVAAADLCLVPSVVQRTLLLELDGGRRLEPRRVVPIVEGVDEELARPREKLRDARLCLGVFSTPGSDRGLESLLRAAATLPPDAWVVRVHTHESPAETSRGAEPAAVQWVRGYTARDLPDLFAALDVVVVLPASLGDVERTVQAARLQRTPLIVCVDLGLEELVRDGVDGLVVPRADDAALATALRRFVAEPELRRALGARSTDLPTLPREVAELEFRYRGLACLERDRVLPSAVVLDVPGRAGAARGATEPQGDGALLLRPGAAVTFNLADVPRGPVELEVTQLALGVEPDVVLGGVLALDGVDLGSLGTSEVPGALRGLRSARRLLERLRKLAFPWTSPRAVAPDRTSTSTFRAWLVAGSSYVTLESREHHTRLVRLRVRSHTLRAAVGGASRDLPTQLRIAEALRVHPGAAPSERELPTVVVIVPTFDGREVLTECLASLAAARYPTGKLQIVVVDNGSTDGTVAHLSLHHPAARVVALDHNRGFAAACNIGARAAGDAQVLVFLNNDMRVAPDFLFELVAPLARRECSATVAKRLSWDGARLDGAGVGSTFAGIAVQPGYGAPPGPEHEVPRRTLFPCGGAMAIDAATFREVGGFDEEFFAYYEDLDLGWRMWVMGHATHYVPTAVAYHHHSHTSKRFPPATVRLVMIRNSLLACVKNYDDTNLARVLPVIVALAARRAHLATGLATGAMTDALRIEHATPRQLAPSGSHALEGSELSIRALGAADLVALDDLLGRWDHWMEQRRVVQARRALPDRAIFPMFLEPLACVEGDAAYQALQRGLLELYHIPELFASGA